MYMYVYFFVIVVYIMYTMLLFVLYHIYYDTFAVPYLWLFEKLNCLHYCRLPRPKDPLAQNVLVLHGTFDK